MAMSLQQTKNLADNIYNARESNMIARQNVFLQEHGVNFQGLDICDVLPSDGNQRVPDFSRKPTDQDEGWTPSDFPPKVPASLRIDVYRGFLNGWIATLSFTYNSDLWIKKHGYDDLESMSHDWQIMEI